MNVTPLAAGPVPTAPAGTNGAAAPGDFLAVLAEALGDGQDPAADAGSGLALPTPGATVEVPADPCPPAATDEAKDVTGAAATADLAAQLIATGDVPAVPATPATPATPAAPATPATPATPAAPRHRQAADVPAVHGPATPATPATGSAPGSGQGAAHRSETGAEHRRADQAPDQAPGRMPTETAPTAAPTSQQTTSQQATPAPSATGPAPVLAPVQAPIAAAPLAAATAATATTPSAQLDQVTAQVFPEVTGLVSRGPGTHRITLTLQPEQLGEVRVVMTMRQGSVHVRLAAGHDAQISLAAGSAELTRLLEQAGITETRIVVRELPSSLAQGATQTSLTLPTNANPDAQLGAGGERNQDQHAGTRADHLATDGADHPRHHRSPVVAEVRPIQTVPGTRAAGVDLTM